MAYLTQCNVRMEADLLAAVDAYAEANGLGRTEAARLLVRKALEQQGELHRVDRDLLGYHDGMRRGMHEAKLQVAAALKRG